MSEVELGGSKWERKRVVYVYGITIEARNGMLAAQAFRCALCECHMERFGTKGNEACVDHCHTELRVRGILCNRCNRALGFYEKLRSNPRVEPYLRHGAARVPMRPSRKGTGVTHLGGNRYCLRYTYRLSGRRVDTERIVEAATPDEAAEMREGLRRAGALGTYVTQREARG